MKESKEQICDQAYELMVMLNTIEDSDFVDEIIECIRYNDELSLGNIRDNLV